MYWLFKFDSFIEFDSSENMSELRGEFWQKYGQINEVPPKWLIPFIPFPTQLLLCVIIYGCSISRPGTILLLEAKMSLWAALLISTEMCLHWHQDNSIFLIPPSPSCRTSLHLSTSSSSSSRSSSYYFQVILTSCWRREIHGCTTTTMA